MYNVKMYNHYDVITFNYMTHVIAAVTEIQWRCFSRNNPICKSNRKKINHVTVENT